MKPISTSLKHIGYRPRLPKGFIKLGCLLFVLFIVLTTQAQVVHTFVPTAPGVYDWQDPNNWDDGGFPAANYPGGAIGSFADFVVFDHGSDVTLINIPPGPGYTLGGLYCQSGITRLEISGTGLEIGISNDWTGFFPNTLEITAGARLVLQGSDDARIIMTDDLFTSGIIVAEIYGTLELASGNGATGVAHQFRVNDDPQSLTLIQVKPGGRVILGSSTGIDRLTGHPFGGTKGTMDTVSNLGYVYFETGSHLEVHDGADPFGPFDTTSSSIYRKIKNINMEPGSTFEFASDWADVFPEVYGNTFANFEYISNVDHDVAFYDFSLSKMSGLGDFYMNDLSVMTPHVLRFDHFGLLQGYISGNIEVPGGGVANSYLRFDPQSTILPVNGGTMQINLNGTSPQNIQGSSTILVNGRSRIESGLGAEVNLDAFIEIEDELSGTFGQFIVNNGSRLNIIGDRYVHGSGAFKLEAGGTLGIGSPDGITAWPSVSGSVQNTGSTRSFANSAAYVYMGLGNQVTGDGLPSATNPASMGLTINLASPANTVTMTNAFHYTRNLDIQSGTLLLDGANMGILGNSSTPGTLNLANDGNLTIDTEKFFFDGRIDLLLSKDLNFHDIEVKGAGGSNHGLDFGPDAAGKATILNEMRMIYRSSFVSVLKPPYYADGSRLYYYSENFPFQISTSGTNGEWLRGKENATDRGVPYHVTIEGIRDLSGNLNIELFSTNVNSYLQCRGDFRFIRSGTISGDLQMRMVPSGSNGPELRVGGNWYFGDNINVIFRTRPVVFNGTGTQMIESEAGSFSFEKLSIHNASGKVMIAPTTNLTVSNNAAFALDFNNGKLDLNGRSLTMTTSGGGIQVTGLQCRIFNSSVIPANFNINASKSVSGSSDSLLFDDNVMLNLNSNFNFGTGNLTRINGQLNINTNSTHTNSPFYGPNSILAYNNNISRTISGSTPEWRPNASSGAGVPANVYIGLTGNAAITLNPTTAGQFIQYTGNLTIGGSASKSLSLGANLSELRIGGNWNRMTGGQFININNKRVVFNGASGDQAITAGDGTETFFTLGINKSAGNLQFSGTDVTIEGNTDSVLNLVNGGLDLNTRTLTFSNANGNIRTSTGVRNIFTSTGTANVIVTGNKAVTSNAGGTLVFGPNTTVQLSGASINFGSSISTVEGTLQLNAGGTVSTNPPSYGTASTLVYNQGISVAAATEWTPISNSGPGVPQNVQVGKTGVNSSVLTFSSSSVFNANGNITIGDAGAGTGYSMNLSSANELGVGGSWLRNSNGTFNANAKITRFVGNANTTIQAPGTGEVFGTLIVDKNNLANAVTLNSPVTATTGLTMGRGRLVTNLINNIEVTNTATGVVSGVLPAAPNGSYIDGPMRRTTIAISGPSAKYLFPVGHFDGTTHHYQPFELRDVTAPATFTAQYFRSTPPGVPGFFGDLISGIMANNYWSFTRNSGSGNARLVFRYDAPPYNWIDLYGDPIFPSSTDNVGVVWLDSINVTTKNWYFPGTGSVFVDQIGDPVEPEARFHSNTGKIRSREFSDFDGTNPQYFTLGFAFNKVLEQPLPVTLLSFSAALQNRDALMNWKIDSQVDLESFEVEYSTNGQRFTRLATIKAAGTSYSYRHNSLPDGLHYYRLVIFDKDGSRKYSKIELVQVGTNKTIIFGLLQNPVRGSEALVKVNSATNQKATVIVVDISGRVVLTQKVSLNNGANQAGVSVAPLTRGLYRLVFRTDDGLEKTMPMMIN